MEELIAELEAIATLARNADAAIEYGRAVNGRSMLKKIADRASDAARVGRWRAAGGTEQELTAA